VTGGHFAFERTFYKIRARFFWPKYRDQINQRCSEFLTCALSKDPLSKNVAALKPIRENYLFEIVISDILGPLKET
jgi:hypothetical protein